MRADPNDPYHQALEREIIAFAEAHSWVVGSGTYHTVMSEVVRVALQQCSDPTALYVRGRADRVAIKECHSRLFEAKTNRGQSPRGSFEVIPLCQYIRLGIPCLYIYRDVKGFEAAFWTTAPPEIDCVMIPDRWDERLTQYFKQYVRTIWPKMAIVDLSWANGSGDPFAVIPRESMTAVAVDWRETFAAVPIIEPPWAAWLQPTDTSSFDFKNAGDDELE